MSSYHCVGVLSDLLDCLHLANKVLTQYVIQISVSNDTILKLLGYPFSHGDPCFSIRSSG